MIISLRLRNPKLRTHISAALILHLLSDWHKNEFSLLAGWIVLGIEEHEGQAILVLLDIEDEFVIVK
jgi:hypothetical protein